MLKEDLHNAISKALGSADFTLLYPRDKAFGDFAVNIHQLKKLGLSNEELLAKFRSIDMFESVELVDTFINMFVSKKLLINEANFVHEKLDSYGKIAQTSPLRIMFEYGTPNTHKLPHIGHLFSYIYGESMARILEWSGNTLFRDNYQGDVGLHVAKCLYIVLTKQNEMESLKTLNDKIRFLQESYQEGSVAYDTNPLAKEAINQINKKIYQQDSSIADLWKETRSWSIEYYEQFEKRLGVNLHRHYFESETSGPGIKVVNENIGKIFEESEGAVVFKGEKYGLHTRVFLTKQGTPTYEAKDLGLVTLKRNEGVFDKIIITTASEQNSYWKVVIKATELIFPDLEGKVMHIGFGLIDLKGGKMSSRTGNIISGVGLIEQITEQVKEKLFAETTQDENIINTVAMGAIKYAFLKSEARKNMYFDIEQSVSIHGNSGPYLQYTYARLKSIIEKAPEGIEALVECDKILTDEDAAILRLIPRFSEAVLDAANSYSPHLLCNYLFELAQLCNALYDKQNILKAEDEIKKMRLSIISAASQVLKNGLYLLGIEVLERI